MPTRSYTNIKMFGQCPHKYKAMIIDKSIPFSTTREQQSGIDVHAALEAAVAKGEALPQEFSQYQQIVDKIRSMPGEILCEHKLAIKTDLAPSGYFEKDAWYRGILDVLVVEGASARIIDYKEGNDAYQDDDQLRENAILVFSNFPNVDTIKASFIYLQVGRITLLEIKRAELETLVLKVSKKEVPMLRAEKLNSFPTQKSHLCNYCQVNTCQYFNRG